jgi:large subunit ribosomal protein L28
LYIYDIINNLNFERFTASGGTLGITYYIRYMICYHCGKGVLFGRSHTHHRGVAGGRWKKRAPKTQKIFSPNLQKVTILEEGAMKSVKLCTKCIKRVKKDIADNKKPFITIAKLVPQVVAPQPSA